MRARNIESLGLLAGGIAHDFNNILTGILGNISLSKAQVPAPGPVHDNLAEAERQAMKARGLTKHSSRLLGVALRCVRR